MYQVCRHEYVKNHETNNYTCSKCSFEAVWGIVQEKNFLTEVAAGHLTATIRQVQSPRNVLIGYIEAVRAYPSVNFTPVEDKELIRYAERLLRKM